MHDGMDVWRKDWREEMVWSLKMGVPTLPIRRLVFILRSFEQIPATIYRRTLAFLPGSRIGAAHPICGGVSSPLFARSIQSAPRNPRTPLQILPRISVQIFSLD